MARIFVAGTRTRRRPSRANMERVANLRPMEADDVTACEELWHHSWAALRLAYGLPGSSPSAEDRARLRRRIEHLRGTDPEGSWVADDDGMVSGIAQAFVRQGLWVLSLLGVAVSCQSQGVGRALMERALGYGPADGPGLIMSSRDPRAMHRYVSAGFRLDPVVAAMGELDRSRLPAGPLAGKVRAGDPGDFERVADISRRQRGAAHGPDLEFLLAQGARLLVSDDGFAVFGATRPVLLAAADADSARALLLAGMADMPDGAEIEVGWMTSSQQWAIRSCVELGLELHNAGAVMVRGAPGPLTPYLPSGAFG